MEVLLIVLKRVLSVIDDLVNKNVLCILEVFC